MRDMRSPDSSTSRGLPGQGDRSIRNIPVPATHRRVAEQEHNTYEEDFTGELHLPKKKKSHWFLWSAALVVIVCAMGGLLLSTVFAGANVAITPRQESVTPPASIQASANAPAGTLAYQVVTTSRTASTTVKANGTEQVSRAASGVITIYNNYSTAAQPLVTNTRFAAQDGNLYRIHTAVTVPGATTNSDGSLNPGTVSVTAYADQPGASYNVGQTQFTIPGFKNTPQYSKFYAQASAMTGGLVGQEPAVAPADLANAEQAMKSGLDNALQNAAATEIPKEFLAIPGTLQVSYDDVARTPSPDGTVTLSQTAVASADIVRANDLAAAIAKQTVQGYNGEAVGFADPTQIAIALASSTKATTGVLQLQLSGSPTLVWQFDPSTLKQALLGKPKSQFENILQSFSPAINCTATTPCKASIRPFWISSFPSDPNKISVTTGQ
ncbi:MAG: hypothetical protein KGH79_01575 [Patescibacteria group bacterium]|nr:hypothetical protein [Patescibacteria group bacterium]